MGRELITFDNVHYEKQVGTLPDGVDAKMVTGHLAEHSRELDENLKGSLGELVKNAAYRARSGRIYIDMDTSRPLTRGDMPKVNSCVMDVHERLRTPSTGKRLTGSPTARMGDVHTCHTRKGQRFR